MSAARLLSLTLLALASLSFFGAASAHADWTATGTFFYTDRTYGTSGWSGTSPEPVRRADVQVYDLATLQVLASGSTSDSGSFSIFVFDSQTRNVAVRVLASTTQTPPLDLTVVDDLNNFAVYAFHDPSTDVIAHAPTLNVSFGTSTMPQAIGDIATTDWSSQVFNGFDMLVRMADWIASVDGTPLARNCRMRWNPNNGRGGSSYGGGSNTVNLADDDGYDDPNILHELGHFVEDEFGRSRNTGGSHTLGDDDQDPRLAWSEGYATYISSAVLHHGSRPRPDVYSDRNSFGTTGGFSYAFEAGQVGGSTRESAVTAALHDLVDAQATADGSPGSDDDSEAGLDLEVWSVTSEMRVRDLPATNLEDFWDLWFELGLGGQSALESIFGSHHIDFFPDANEPNGTFDTATTLPTDGTVFENTFYAPVGDPAADEDCFQFNAVAGTTYSIAVSGGGNTIFSRPDPEMFLFDALAGKLLAASFDPLDTSLNTQSSGSAQDMDETVPSLRWRAPASGVFHLMLRHARRPLNRTRYGTYQLKVETVAATTPTVTEVSAPPMLPGQTYSVLVRGENFAVDATVSSSDPAIEVIESIVLSPEVIAARLAIGSTAAPGTPSISVASPGTGAGTLGAAIVIAPDAAPPVVISEVEVGGEDRLEVRNLGTVSANLTGWQVLGRTTSTSTANRIFDFPPFVLPAGGTVTVSEASGTDTATELYDQGNAVVWSWSAGSTGDVSLINPTDVCIDYVRFVRGFVTTHLAPPGTGMLWMQPEVLGPTGGTSLARAETSALYRTSFGLSPAQPTLPDGAAGRTNLVDPFEDNDTAPRSAIIDATTELPGLAIDPRPNGADEDWFGVIVGAGETPLFQLEFSHADVDLTLFVYAPGESQAPLMTSATSTDNETVHLSALTTVASGIYRVRIFAEGGSTGSYTLRALRDAAAGDCDGDGTLDAIEIAFLGAGDCDDDGVPDSCAEDCDGNGIPDTCEIASGTGTDTNQNGLLDACELLVRGDCNDDASFDIADAISLLAALFPPPGSNGDLGAFACADACDGNDDGALDVADGITLLTALFGPTPIPPAPPSSECGVDPTVDSLTCGAAAGCP